MPFIADSGDAKGTQEVSALDTEYDLYVLAENGVFVYAVDARELQEGELLTLRIYSKLLSDGDEGKAYEEVFTFGTTDVTPLLYSIPVPSPFESRFTLEQTGGSTGNEFDWVIYRVDR